MLGHAHIETTRRIYTADWREVKSATISSLHSSPRRASGSSHEAAGSLA